MSRSTAWMPRPQGRRTQAIINTNLKTELCRNWQNGACTYGERCAFAHGKNELKYRTLREMQNAGRIPDAAKYRCFPCMTWVATGSCPYSTRCVFIHDPRVSGPVAAWLNAGKHPSSAYQSSDSSLFFPDLPRDPDSLDLPGGPSLYDLDPSMASAQDRAQRAVYNLWYSFVFTFSEASGDNDTPAMPATTPSSVATNPDLNTVRVASQTTGRIRFCADNTSRAPSVGFSPRPPPAADNIAFPTANNGYNVDSSPHLSRIEEQLLVAEPRHFDTSLTRLPVFRRLGKENRAPPLNYRSRDTSTEGLTTPPDNSYERDLRADGGLPPYSQRSNSPCTSAQDGSLYYHIPVPKHSFPPTVAVTKTPPSDYHLVSESPAMPTLQPVEIVGQSSGSAAAREDGMSAATRIAATPPGYLVHHHEHLPTFSGYSPVGSQVDTSLTQPRTMYSVASF